MAYNLLSKLNLASAIGIGAEVVDLLSQRLIVYVLEMWEPQLKNNTSTNALKARLPCRSDQIRVLLTLSDTEML